MAISLSDLRKVKSTLPARLIIHGVPKVGKTTLASEFPNPVFIQTEDGENEIEITSFGKLNSYQDVIDAMASLFSDDHDFKTLVFDTTTALELLIFQEVIRKFPTTEKGKPVKNVEDYGFGKGYAFALDLWREILDGINHLRRERGMTIIFLSHSNVEKQSPPDGEPYNRYGIRLSKVASEYLQGEFDMILFLDIPRQMKETDAGFGSKHKFASGTGSFVRINMDRGNPAYVGGSRFDSPPFIRYDKGKGFEALAPYLPTYSAPAIAEVATEQKDAA